MKEKNIYKQAGAKLRTIVFPEAGFSDRTIEAVKIIQKKKAISGNQIAFPVDLC